MRQHPKNSIRGINPSERPIEKVDVTEWLEIKQHARGMYLSLNPKHSRIYDLQQHDFMKVKLIAVRKAPRDDSEEERPER